MIHRKAHNLFFVILGGFFLVVGVIGIFLPLLPTTPFLLLTAFCFNRGSPRFHRWLLQHKMLGPPILDWKRKQMIRTKYKWLASAMIGVTCVFVLRSPDLVLLGKSAYTGFITCVLIFIWTRPGR